jgi:hypothetical protein
MMAIRPRSLSIANQAVRYGTIGFCIFSLSWALFALPVFLRQSSLEYVSKRIVAGDQFRVDALGKITESVAASSAERRDSFTAQLAIVHLRMLEQAKANGDQLAVDRATQLLRYTLVQALSQAPSDSFLWLVFFWLENSIQGFSTNHLKYLEFSYRTGPNEGWIAVKRNRLALVVYQKLDSQLATLAGDEFARLLDSGFVVETASIFTGPGWSVRNILLPRLETVGLAQRQQFAKLVYRLGYNVLIPGVVERGQRPWD